MFITTAKSLQPQLTSQPDSYVTLKNKYHFQKQLDRTQ